MRTPDAAVGPEFARESAGVPSAAAARPKSSRRVMVTPRIIDFVASQVAVIEAPDRRITSWSAALVAFLRQSGP